MERTLISWNVPNLVTIPLMAFAGFLVAALLWQGAMRLAPGLASSSSSSSETANNTGGY